MARCLTLPDSIWTNDDIYTYKIVSRLCYLYNGITYTWKEDLYIEMGLGLSERAPGGQERRLIWLFVVFHDKYFMMRMVKKAIFIAIVNKIPQNQVCL